ncbi:MAG: hypothetical protein M1596_04920 [Firmicutes bacterium]|nr:hypothetical protein [Bacillota bacterium]
MIPQLYGTEENRGITENFLVNHQEVYFGLNRTQKLIADWPERLEKLRIHCESDWKDHTDLVLEIPGAVPNVYERIDELERELLHDKKGSLLFQHFLIMVDHEEESDAG